MKKTVIILIIISIQFVNATVKDSLQYPSPFHKYLMAFEEDDDECDA